MSETDLLQLSAAWRRVPHMVAPLQRDVWNALCTWNPSWQTQRLASETTRNLFVELVSFSGGEKCRPFEIARETGVSGGVPKKLGTIVLEFLVRSFDGGPEPAQLTCCQVREFGSYLSTELPLLKIIDLKSETYWRRVVRCYSSDCLSYYEHDYLTPNRFWKQHGVEVKLGLMIEQQDPRYWEVENLEETIKRCAPFVENLCVEQMLPHPKVEPMEDYEAYSYRNAPEDLCHHGSLAVLGHLSNLTSLSLVFGVKHWTKPYQDRYSNCSQEDIENLGLGLRKLEKLKKFNLSRSRLNPQKLKALLDHLTPLRLDTIRLQRCQLGRGCGGILGRFLSRFGPTLKHLNLSDNRLDALELDRLCPGLSVYQGTVDSLDLSYNPVGEPGVLVLGGAIKGGPQLSELNFTGCQMGVEGSFRVIQLLSFHAPLRKVSLNCVPISPEGGDKLVQVLRENTHIEDVQVGECGLPEEVLSRVKRILRKNAKRRHRAGTAAVTQHRKPLQVDATEYIRSPASMYRLERQVFPPATTGT
ncbi:dynein regulatory complex subunit 5-like [Anopheles nili]|uniref:dynein regulatory complex subunit 5-like n=1 Tax=Anopheles nili TaxID=185578 RepID=UPI00237A7DDD|nr:dynein regulatory complex subunit 5-like [Anopheles nili]